MTNELHLSELLAMRTSHESAGKKLHAWFVAGLSPFAPAPE